MKLQTLSRVEFAFNVFIAIVMLPFCIINIVLWVVRYPFDRIVDLLALLRQRVGNILLKKSDEVKDGTICNPMCLRQYTARFALKELKRQANLK